MRAADHEPEVARTRASDRATLALPGESIENRRGVLACLRQRKAQRGKHLLARRARTHVALGKRVQEPGGVIVGAPEKRVIDELMLAHGKNHSGTLLWRQVGQL